MLAGRTRSAVRRRFFPEEFDRIISGAAGPDYSSIGFHTGGTAVATLCSGDAMVTPKLTQFVSTMVTRQCDALGGVTDGLIQNPAACNFKPERDLPLCDGSNAGQCFTKAQTETISSLFSAATDEHGRVVQPGYSVSEPTAALSPTTRPADLGNPLPWTSGDRTSGSWSGAEGLISVLASGTVTAADMRKLLRSRTKLIIYSNLSDQVVNPYLAIDYFKSLAALHGSYSKLQRNARLFALPDSGHCGMSGLGPTNFDAIGALEAWVERGPAPDALLARQNDPEISTVIAGRIDWSKPALRTMPLCKFPEMARYQGTGDIKDAANQVCKTGDISMLRIGDSGRQAGVID